MNAPGVAAASSSAFRTAPFIPSAPGVRTSSAPKIARSCLRSMLIVSGMVRIRRYPLAAATKARAIPVLPLVGSMITDPSFSSPFFSASSIIATPIRSFTLERGLKDSILTTTSAGFPLFILFRRTSGVFPMVFVISS